MVWRTRWAAKTDRLFQPGAAELQKRHKSVTLLWNSLLSTSRLSVWMWTVALLHLIIPFRLTVTNASISAHKNLRVRAGQRSYNNRNPALGVLWSWHRVASPSIEIPIQIWKKKFADKLHKSYKKHLWQNFTYPFWTLYFCKQNQK